MKTLFWGILFAGTAVLAAEPSYQWNFDNLNKNGKPVGSHGLVYHGALIAPDGGVTKTNALLCNGKGRNHIVLSMDSKEWTAEFKFKLDQSESNQQRTLFAYEHRAWNIARFLLYIDRNGRLTGDFRTLKMPEQKIDKNFVFSSEKISWEPGKWYTLRVASKSGGPARIWLDGKLVAGRENALSLSDLNDGKKYQWFPQITLGCDPANPSRNAQPLMGVMDDLKLWKSYEEPAPQAAGTAEKTEVAGTALLMTRSGTEWSTPFKVLDKENVNVLGDFWKAEDKFVKNAARAAVGIHEGFMIVKFQCPVPADVSLNTDKNSSIWNECVEFFLRPDLNSPAYFQYAAGANGKLAAYRYPAVNTPDSGFKTRMTGHVEKTANGYTAEMKIPLNELGIKDLQDGASMSANFTRTGKSGGGLSTWAPVGMSFHNPERFGTLIVGSRRAYTAGQIARLRQELAGMNTAADAKSVIEKRLAALEKNNAASGESLSFSEKAAEQLASIRQDMVAARLAGCKILLWKPDVWGNNIEVSMISRPVENIRLINGISGRTLYGFVCSNLTDRPFLGQLKLFPGQYPGKTNQSLFNSDSGFTELFSRVRIFEGIPQMSSSGSILYDAMNPLPLNTLIRIPPKTSIPLWLDLSTEDVPAGIYDGTLVLKPAYSGFSLEKIPFEFEVLPVDLSKVFVRNFHYTYLECRGTFHRFLLKENEISPHLRFLAEHQVNFVSFFGGFPYPEIDKDGNAKPMDYSSIDSRIDAVLAAGTPLKELSVLFYLGWEQNWNRLYRSQALPAEKGKPRPPSKMIPPDCAFGSPQWNRAAQTVFKAMTAHIQQKYHIPAERIIYYPVDEPSGSFEDPKSRNHLALWSGRLIKEAVPECRIMVNPFFPGNVSSAEQIATIKRYCEVYDIIELYRPSIASAENIQTVKNAGRELWTYNILHKEVSPEVYRRIYWENFRDGVDDVAAFWHFDSMAGGDGFDPFDSNRYKKENRTDYGTVYAEFNFGKIMTGRRMEAHFQGLYDYKAAKLCRQLLKQKPDAAAEKKLNAAVVRAINGDCDTMDAARIELLRLAAELQKRP